MIKKCRVIIRDETRCLRMLKLLIGTHRWKYWKFDSEDDVWSGIKSENRDLIEVAYDGHEFFSHEKWVQMICDDGKENKRKNEKYSGMKNNLFSTFIIHILQLNGSN
jgi:hypothetical protein